MAAIMIDKEKCALLTKLLRLGQTIRLHWEARCPDPYGPRKQIDPAPMLKKIADLTGELQKDIAGDHICCSSANACIPEREASPQKRAFKSLR